MDKEELIRQLERYSHGMCAGCDDTEITSCVDNITSCVDNITSCVEHINELLRACIPMITPGTELENATRACADMDCNRCPILAQNDCFEVLGMRLIEAIQAYQA